VQPAVFFFSTGLPDGKIATISEPPNAHNNNVEFETADDFLLNTETVINHASFTGLLTGGATLKNVDNVFLTIYRVFPNDSDLTRTPQVPTRNNSPADNEIDNFDSNVGDVSFSSRLLSASFTAQKSVSSVAKIALGSGGDGQVTGEEVQFDVTFNAPLDLPAGHYFFVPKVGLKANAPAAADFLELSAPKPITPPGTPFLPDLQSWMRSSPGINPDWLRIGQDIIGGNVAPFPTFNASFSLSGHTVPPHIAGLSQSSVAEGSPDLTLTINGSNFTTNSTVVIDGTQPLVTTFLSSTRLQAVIPAALLAEEGHFKISVLDSQNGESNARTFHVKESVPAIDATVTQGQIFQEITLTGQVTDPALEAHPVRIHWGDGQVQTIDANPDGSFTVRHTFVQPPGHVHHDTIVVRALDDEGVKSDRLVFDVLV
jgi:hypothetical protein